MCLLVLTWTLIMVSPRTADSLQVPQFLPQDPVKLLYPIIADNETIECHCVSAPCDTVYWFRSNSSHAHFQYLGKYNRADRPTYPPGVDQSRYKFNKKSSSCFVLRVLNVKREDEGIYSCVQKETNTEIWRTGSVLHPREFPPTPPRVKQMPTKLKPPCYCSKKVLDGACEPSVQWPLVGLAVGLAASLICTLYYFSRLPQKCRHHFVRARKMP